MNSTHNSKKDKIQVPISLFSLIATWFFVGRIPFAPGTIGSLAVYPVYAIIVNSVEDIEQARLVFLLLAFLLTIVGTLAIESFQKQIKIHDHQCIVIDEVVGMLVMLGLTFNMLVYMALALDGRFNWHIEPVNIAFFIVFIVFRYFDIRKPLFIKSADRYVRNAFGVMLDDILAALFGSAIIFIMYLLVIAFV